MGITDPADPTDLSDRFPKIRDPKPCYSVSGGITT